MIYVIDGSALSAIPHRVTDTDLVLDCLQERVEDGQLRFCNEVRDLMAELATERVARWVRRVRRVDKGADFTFQRLATEFVPDLVDPDAGHSEPVAVLAHALSYHEVQFDVTVVTEDTLKPPTRLHLAAACDCVGIPWIDLPKYLNHCGLAHVTK